MKLGLFQNIDINFFATFFIYRFISCLHDKIVWIVYDIQLQNQRLVSGAHRYRMTQQPLQQGMLYVAYQQQNR